MQCDTKDVMTDFVSRPVTIGKILGAYGVLGWSRIISFTEQCSDVFNYNPCFVILESKWKLIYLDRWRLIGKRYIAKIRGITNRDSAQSLAQCNIIIDEKQIPRTKNDEYYWRDLIGCKVITVEGLFLGNIVNIIETTANDVLVVQMCKNNFVRTKDFLIPFLLKRVIKNVDLVTHTVIVDWNYDF